MLLSPCRIPYYVSKTMAASVRGSGMDITKEKRDCIKPHTSCIVQDCKLLTLKSGGRT